MMRNRAHQSFPFSQAPPKPKLADELPTHKQTLQSRHCRSGKLLIFAPRSIVHPRHTTGSTITTMAAFDYLECERSLQRGIKTSAPCTSVQSSVAESINGEETLFATDAKKTLATERHLTTEQRKDIATGLQDSAPGPVSMAAPASDREAVGYQREIANVLEDMGCKVEIDNAKTKTSSQQIPTGVEMTIKDETVRPIHASRIVLAFRRAGLVFATKINAMRRKNDTLYITVGANDGAALIPLIIPTSPWQWKSVVILLGQWKEKFISAVRLR